MTAPGSATARSAAAAAFLAGFACMAAELTAVRVLAPHFGDSAYVWTNVIGVILFALALGAYSGGRLAGRDDASRWPTRLLAASGLCLAAAPLLAGPVGAFLLPPSLPLDAAMPAIVRGSFVASALLFVPPMLLLGAVAPLLVALLARASVPVGRAAGTVSAAGTLGSLLGTFAATHGLVPHLGSRGSLWVSALALVVAGLIVARRGRAQSLVACALVGASWFAHSGVVRVAPPGQELLAERESHYQFLQVLRQPAGDGPARTRLVINEGLDSFHSLAVDGSSFTGGAYYDWHAVVPWLAGEGRRPDGLRVLSIGDAAGSLRKVYAAAHPGCVFDGVDLDPATMELGERFFAGPKAAGASFALDGRLFVAQARDRWHAIHVDAYAHQVYVPAHLASREFFLAARERLLDDGVLACNVGALHPADPVLRAIGTTVASVFGHAIATQVPDSRNFLLVARRGRSPDPACLPPVVPEVGHLGAADAETLRTVLRKAGDPKVWYDVGRGGELLVDDRPVLDHLLHASYVQTADPDVVVACRGAVDPRGAEIDAFEAARRRDWQRVLDIVADSRAPTADLRELAGDARWSLRQLGAAAREYRAGAGLTDGAARDRLRRKLDQVVADAGPAAAAAAVAARNGWFALAAIAALGALAWVVQSRLRCPTGASMPAERPVG